MTHPVSIRDRAACCGGCYFYAAPLEDDNTSKGECRSEPPKIIMVPVQSISGPVLKQKSVYPLVDSDDIGCGRHWSRKDIREDNKEIAYLAEEEDGEFDDVVDDDLFDGGYDEDE